MVNTVVDIAVEEVVGVLVPVFGDREVKVAVRLLDVIVDRSLDEVVNEKRVK